MCVLGFYFSNSTLIQYKVELLSNRKSDKRRFEHDEFNYSYPTIKESNGLLLCSTMQVYELYTRRLIQCGNCSKCFNNTDSITKVCKVFTELKNINNKFKGSYEEQIDKSLEAISLLTHASRDKR